jgi:CRP-like cAMP-binding protein
MTHELLLAGIAKYIHLNEEEKNLFLSYVQTRKVKKKQHLLLEGDVNRFAFFVASGCLRSYHLDENGFEYIQQFAPEGWWIGDMYSLITQEPGHLYIDALLNSEILLISKANLEKLYLEVPKFNYYFRILAEKSLVSYQTRAMENLRLTAKQRYEKFCSRYPGLIDALSQKLVAAYIGVTPEFLSKMLHDSPSLKR